MNNKIKQKSKSIIILSLMLFAFGLFFTPSSDALLQQAGSISISVSPGQTQSFTWGLQSNDQKTITVKITAEQNGSEFLRFPNSMTINPDESVFVPVDVSIPSDYNGAQELSPILVATEYGNQNGATVINIQMAKTVTIIIDNTKMQDNSEEKITQSKSNDEQIQGKVTITNNLSPLVQTRQGVEPQDVSCDESLKLILKPNGDSSACVTPKTMQKLLDRGWITP